MIEFQAEAYDDPMTRTEIWAYRLDARYLQVGDKVWLNQGGGALILEPGPSATQRMIKTPPKTVRSLKRSVDHGGVEVNLGWWHLTRYALLFEEPVMVYMEGGERGRRLYEPIGEDLYALR